MQEPTDHAQEEDQWDEEYEEGEDEEYEDYDAPQVGDMIVTVGEVIENLVWITNRLRVAILSDAVLFIGQRCLG